jgi:hypothetical protein
MSRCGLPCGVFQKPARAHDWALLLALSQLSSEKFCKAEHQCLHRSTAEQGQGLLVLYLHTNKAEGVEEKRTRDLVKWQQRGRC